MWHRIGTTWLGVDSHDYRKDSHLKLLHATPLGFLADNVQYNFTDDSHLDNQGVHYLK